jgi:NADH-quinone oxidoreductase subunit H
MGADVLEITINCIKLILIFLMMVQAVPVLVWVERRGSAFIQNRFGPNRVGPLGLMQLLADAVKFLNKEDFFPDKGVKFFYFAAPVLALIPGAVALSAIPLSTPLYINAFDFMDRTWGPYTILFQGYEIGVGIVFVLGVSSLATYAILMAGWGSGNKYSLLGALRASAQMISYELALGLSIVGVLLLHGSFNFSEIISGQAGSLSFQFLNYTITAPYLPNWGIFYQPIGALIFFVAAFAESNRLPFDLAEGEAELVAGFHVEYGGFKMLMFFIGEYGHMMVGSALFITFFLGGFALPIPFLTPEYISKMLLSNGFNQMNASIVTALIFFASFSVKLVTLLWIFIWVRWTLPRFRYDQLMDLGWKTMLPWALANTVITAVVMQLAHSS